MANPPFKHWYAIVNYRSWYLGIHITKDEAEEKAIRVFNVHHSKGGYCIMDEDCYKATFLWMRGVIERDFGLTP